MSECATGLKVHEIIIYDFIYNSTSNTPPHRFALARYSQLGASIVRDAVEAIVSLAGAAAAVVVVFQ